VEITRDSFKEIELFKKSNWRNFVRNPIVNNFILISLIGIIFFLGKFTYNSSKLYFNNNELWGTISGKYNTTKGDDIDKQEDLFTVDVFYDSINNIGNSNALRGNSKLLVTNDRVPLKYIINKEEKEIFDLGDIGDFIGGYFGFWVGIIGALLTFLAFYVQYRANRVVQKQFRQQQFENQLHKMIDVYINNKDKFSNPGYKNPKNESINLVQLEGNSLIEKLENLSNNKTTKVNNTSLFSFISFNNTYLNQEGNNQFFEYNTRDHIVFKKFIVELKVINRVFIEAYKLSKNIKEKDLDVKIKKELFTLSYRVFFDGLNKFAKDDSKPRVHYVEHAIRLLKAVRKIHKKDGTKVFENFYKDKNDIDKNLWLKLNYEPFQGYLHFLPQYFRGLYSIVNYVVNENEDLNLSKEQKKIYLRTLRSTMSEYEQTLLFYNWFSGFGKDWEKGINSFLIDYKMIHNLKRITLIEDDLDLKEIFNLDDKQFKEAFDNF